MDKYTILFLQSIGLLIFVCLLLWIILVRSRTNRKMHLRDASLVGGELEEHAKKTALGHAITLRQTRSIWPVPKMDSNYERIQTIYKGLNEDIRKKKPVPPAAEWLLDNFYILEEQVKGLRRDLNKRSYSRLPVLKGGLLKGEARIMAIAAELVAHTDGKIDEALLSDYLKAYQSNNVLADREIWALPMVLRLVLIENIAHLCENILHTQQQWKKADSLIDDWLEQPDTDSDRVFKHFVEGLHTHDAMNPSFVEHLFYRLRRSGHSYAHLQLMVDKALTKQDTTTEHLTQHEHSVQSLMTLSMGNNITSLHLFATLDWSNLFENASAVEQILKTDPDGTYPLMDLHTRNHYRSRVEELAAIHGVSERHIAREAIALAELAFIRTRDDLELANRLLTMTDSEKAEVYRKGHVGYYLIDKGIQALEMRQGKKARFHQMAVGFGKRSAGILYIGSIGFMTTLLVFVAIRYAQMTSSWPSAIWIIAGLVSLLPASEIAVSTVNWIVCKALKPAVFPRMELKNGIPEEFSTIVVVPTLLPNTARVKELLSTLECHYLSNREDNLYFALVGGFMDSDQIGSSNDKRIIASALDGVKELNRKYAGKEDRFFFFHRENQFNELHNKWIGWERKRGALMEFNDLVLGSKETSFSYASNQAPPFSHVRYIITLDSDTILPIGMARKMIGTMAHPLNRPVIDRKRGIVTEGYGLMQPRIDVEVESANKSLFSRIFTAQEGLDPYANAISDVYQDLFGEGIYTGKGIYDLAVFREVLRNAVPDNSILSHDLMEGSYVRTGLVTDLKLVDAHPAKYNAYSARAYRWARGDWQLFPLLFGKILNFPRNRINNPLSLLSRWKIFDNLRRTLISPSLIVLIILGFSLLPGSLLVWYSFFIITLSLPLITALIGKLFSRRNGSKGIKRYMPVMIGLKAAFLQTILTLSFLPYQAWSMISAAVITMVRVTITRKNLLEWVTSADIERTQKNTVVSYAKSMQASFWIAISTCGLITFLKPSVLLFFVPLFILWMGGPFIAFWISQAVKAPVHPVTAEQLRDLGRIARRTWRYFEEFTDARSHYLTPDNYQADPPRGIAFRTSPTNIGLGLTAILSAKDFGYIGTKEMMDLLIKTIANMENLEKWNGHLYNWYDTRTMKPLHPAYISTVDSGNLACYLIALAQGLLEIRKRPLVDARFTEGLRDTLLCAGAEGASTFGQILMHLEMPGSQPIQLTQFRKVLIALLEEQWLTPIKNDVWKAKAIRSIKMRLTELDEWMPAVAFLANIPADLLQNSNHTGVSADLHEMLEMLNAVTSLRQLAVVSKEAINRVESIIEILQESGMTEEQEGMLWLINLDIALRYSLENAEQVDGRMMNLISRVQALADNMRFEPLFEPKKQLFSIGFMIEDNKLTNSYYDLLASEARQTSYLCIARGEIPVSHWSRMGRALTVVDGYKGLISWTGTMFEYFMPLLLMKSYANTILDETYSFVIKSQKKYGRQRNMPWGTSESAFHSMDASLDYQYKAIGVPWLGLRRGLIEDAVAAPYATFLALQVDPVSAIKNIERLKKEGLDGPYGFYEAVDYTPERLPFESKRAVIKSFMAHHQGMSILALNNFLHGNIMQKRFHAEPAIHAARLLLQEKIPANLLFTKDRKDKVLPFKEVTAKDANPYRRYSKPDSTLQKAHILSNGNYTVMVTDRGTGYSRTRVMDITRWRADSTLDTHGMFFYLRNVETDVSWSATDAPMLKKPDKQEIIFSSDKATFTRYDGTITTETEVMVTTGDNAEIRRISIKNRGTEPQTIEVTSCFEVVLAPQASDIAHMAFSNLFVETAYIEEHKCITATRRPRTENDKNIWLAHAVITDADTIGTIQYETDRLQWLGRGHQMSMPISLERGRPLSGSTGAVLDPVMSLRTIIQVNPGKTVRVSFLTTISDSQELLLALVDKYASNDAVEGAFRLALTRSQVENRYLNLDESAMQLYQEMISDILFISPYQRAGHALARNNKKGQSALWAYGISGDRPIVLLTLKRKYQVEILYNVLRAHEYWKLMGLKVDLVILGMEEHSYLQPLQDTIRDIVLSRQTRDVSGSPGDVFILNQNNLPEADVWLLHAVAKIVLHGDGRTIAEQMTRPALPELPAIRKLHVTEPSAYIASKAPLMQLNNGIGGFRPDGNEYMIRLEEGQYTPAPWVNVIATPTFGFFVSESGSGYTWSENSREFKLTPWSNDAVADTPGEAIYISDVEDGAIWTPTALPIREREPYTIRHGFGYSAFEHASHGIEQWMTQHVPEKASVKISILGLKNVSMRKRHLSVTFYMQPVLGVNEYSTVPLIKTVTGSDGVLMIENTWREDFADRITFVAVSADKQTQTSSRKEFFGLGNPQNPECLAREGLSGMTGPGDPCAAIQVSVVLEPNERKEIVWLLGNGKTQQEVMQIAEDYRSVDKARQSLADTKSFWKEKLGIIKVKSPVVPLNIMLSGWLPYQVLSCRLWARSGFYQSGGAFGFRDQLQDSLAIANLWPEVTRSQILRHAAHQFIQGDVQHWWHEPLNVGTRTRISDDLLWLPYVVAEYIRITNDAAILMEEVPFLDDAILAEFEEERYSKAVVSQEVSTLLDHCIRAIDHTLRFGVHGLPLMGTGDWNDGMNTVGNKGAGESVWLGWFLLSVLDVFTPHLRPSNEQVAERYDTVRQQLMESIEREAWDGNWYKRAWFDNGQVLGSIQNKECKIDSIAQTWAVLSGAGDQTRMKQAMLSVDDWLVNRENGLIKLFSPPFSDGELEPGYIKGYLPGVRENGGQYTHAAAWTIIAYAMLGDGDKAWELFELINPINHTANQRECMRYKVEPYVMAADVYAVQPHAGRGGWSWYTGSAGWMYRAGLEYLLGFKKMGDAIVLDPCIPKKWSDYEIHYRYLESTYAISVKNPDGVNKGVVEMIVDGLTIEGNRFDLINDGMHHNVVCRLGS